MKRKKKFDKLTPADLAKIKSQLSQELQCSCGRWVKGVSIDAVSIKCPICVCLMVPIEKKLEKQESGFPRGWKLYAKFVHADGRVFCKGVEDPKLKGTLPPTDIAKIKEKALANKKTKKEREAKKEEKLVKQFKKKQQLKKKEKLAKAVIEFSDEDKKLISAIKEDIILDVIQVNDGKYEAVDKKQNKYSSIIRNQPKLKYAFSRSKKIIGKRVNKELINWKVYSG